MAPDKSGKRQANPGRTIVNPGYFEVHFRDTPYSKEYKKYRKLWHSLPKQHKVSDFPLHLDIENSSVCNLSCRMCARSHMRLGNHYMSFSLFKSIFDFGIPKSIKLNYRNEPLTHPRVAEMVEYAKNLGVIEVMFNTNGTLLTESLVHDLIAAGLDKIIFSIDSHDPETYKEIRGVDLNDVLRNIKLLLSIRDSCDSCDSYPVIRVQKVRLPNLEHENKSYLEFFRDLGVDHVAFVPFRNRSPYLLSLGKYYHSRPEFPCPQIWQRLVITYEGKVLMCCGDLYERNPLGYVPDMHIPSIWRGDKLEQFRNLHIKGESHMIPSCRPCEVNKCAAQLVERNMR